jgi:hypothetical protein
MNTEVPSQSTSSPTRSKHAWMNGYTVFAVSIMIVLGFWQILAGLTAVVRDGLYAKPPDTPSRSTSRRGVGWSCCSGCSSPGRQLSSYKVGHGATRSQPYWHA